MPESGVTVTYEPRDLLQRLEKFPRQVDAAMKTAIDQAMKVTLEVTPDYPAKPAKSRYRRTFTLQRTLTAGSTDPRHIFESKRLGEGSYEGQIGTNLSYAQYVIGDGTEGSRAQATHMSHWWTTKTWAKAAEKKIQRVYEIALERLAAWVDGRG